MYLWLTEVNDLSKVAQLARGSGLKWITTQITGSWASSYSRLFTSEIMCNSWECSQTSLVTKPLDYPSLSLTISLFYIFNKFEYAVMPTILWTFFEMIYILLSVSAFGSNRNVNPSDRSHEHRCEMLWGKLRGAPRIGLVGDRWVQDAEGGTVAAVR